MQLIACSVKTTHMCISYYYTNSHTTSCLTLLSPPCPVSTQTKAIPKDISYNSRRGSSHCFQTYYFYIYIYIDILMSRHLTLISTTLSALPMGMALSSTWESTPVRTTLPTTRRVARALGGGGTDGFWGPMPAVLPAVLGDVLPCDSRLLSPPGAAVTSPPADPAGCPDQASKDTGSDMLSWFMMKKSWEASGGRGGDGGGLGDLGEDGCRGGAGAVEGGELMRL